MNCPNKCEVPKYSNHTRGRFTVMKAAELSRLDFKVLSKSGKTLFHFYECPKCHSVFKKGVRVKTLHAAKQETKQND